VTQRYARIYDEKLHKQFKKAISQLDSIAIEDWLGSETVQAEGVQASLGVED
jgi:hypothetical protein